MIYIGIDNGVTGSVAMIADDFSYFYKTPVQKEQSYTKKKQSITRINYQGLYSLIESWKNDDQPIKAILERPMVNPGRFKNTASALRALESTLIVLENLSIPYQYIDSKEWQKVMLPKGIKRTPDLKKASVDIGCRLFPQYKELITKHKDADGLLIAEYARRARL